MTYLGCFLCGWVSGCALSGVFLVFMAVYGAVRMISADV